MGIHLYDFVLGSLISTIKWSTVMKSKPISVCGVLNRRRFEARPLCDLYLLPRQFGCLLHALNEQYLTKLFHRLQMSYYMIAWFQKRPGNRVVGEESCFSWDVPISERLPPFNVYTSCFQTGWLNHHVKPVNLYRYCISCVCVCFSSCFAWRCWTLSQRPQNWSMSAKDVATWKMLALHAERSEIVW